MYRISPIIYFTAALIAAALGNTSITCAPDELLRLPAPGAYTCEEFMQPYIHSNGGYLIDPGSNANCDFCAYSDSNSILQNMGINYSDRWVDFAITLVYSLFNVVITLLFYWLFRVPKKSKVQRQCR